MMNQHRLFYLEWSTYFQSFASFFDVISFGNVLYYLVRLLSRLPLFGYNRNSVGGGVYRARPITSVEMMGTIVSAH